MKYAVLETNHQLGSDFGNSELVSSSILV